MSLANSTETEAVLDDQSEQLRFGFGRNWSQYIDEHFSQERVATAQQHLLRVLGLDSLEGMSILDIGSGSGLHSLGAHLAGASRIVSFDYDPASVETTKVLRERAGAPEEWKVIQGSVLDEDFVKSLGKFDIVYSWGVLHHTGDVWKAIRNSSLALNDSAIFYIALYSSDIYVDPPASYWLEIKKRYNKTGRFGKRLMEWRYALRHNIIPDLKHRKNPLDYIRGYSQSRGMDYWTDVRDWLGGWPMEFCGNEETKTFCNDELGLECLNLVAGEGNTEFIFRKNDASNYWDGLLADMGESRILQGPFQQVEEHCFSVKLPAEMHESCDSVELPRRSKIMLFEDGNPVGFGHQQHAQIIKYGAGRSSHWQESLWFSSTDGTNPNTNGRVYTYLPCWPHA